MTSRQLLCVVACLFLAANVCPVGALNNGAARTPPMGWLSWAWFRCNLDCTTNPTTCISEQLYMDMADMMVEKGFRDAGYEYVNIDDCWSSVDRDADGNQQSDPERFPHGIKWLADYMHERGLKLGLYSDVGNTTCNGGHFTGMGGHFKQDAELFASWGIDSLKIDGCGADASIMNQTYPEIGRYLLEATNKTGAQPILYVCSWPAYAIYNHLPIQFRMLVKYCNQWRNSYDIQNHFSSVSERVSAWAGTAAYNLPYTAFVEAAQPGAWNDPDQLLIGNGFLTPEQCRFSMSLWSLWAAPLLMSNDLRNISDWETAILLNKEVIAVNQDVLGKQGTFVNQTTIGPSAHSSFHGKFSGDEDMVEEEGAKLQLWRKDLSNGDVAVVINSMTPSKWCSANYTMQFEDVGFANVTRVNVRDLWLQKDMGTFTTSYSISNLNCSDASMLRLSLAD